MNDGSRLGTGFRAWSASVIFARWIHSTIQQFQSKVVIEVRRSSEDIARMLSGL